MAREIERGSLPSQGNVRTPLRWPPCKQFACPVRVHLLYQGNDTPRDQRARIPRKRAGSVILHGGDGLR